MAPVDAERPSLVELRVLEGANLYFPRAAVKLTLDISTLLALPDASARQVGQSLGLAAARPGAPGTGGATQRVHLDARVVGQRQEPRGGGDGARLAERVLGIGGLALGRQDDARELGEILDAVREIGEEGGHLLALGPVGRGQDQPPVRG